MLITLRRKHRRHVLLNKSNEHHETESFIGNQHAAHQEIYLPCVGPKSPIYIIFLQNPTQKQSSLKPQPLSTFNFNIILTHVPRSRT